MVTQRWRPDGWENPHKVTGVTLSYYRDDLNKAYEAGAGAMLEALLNSCESYAPNSLILRETLDTDRKGRWVFIPEGE